MRCRGTTESRPSDGACWIGCTWRSIATWTDCSSPSAYGWQAETSHRSRSGKGLQKREQNPRFESYNRLIENSTLAPQGLRARYEISYTTECSPDLLNESACRSGCKGYFVPGPYDAL